ncbi:unnamed protein product, partial [Discosporangium mesarthrocarpum]
EGARVGWAGLGGCGGEGQGVRWLSPVWAPAMKLRHHRGVQLLIDVVDAMSSQRALAADTAICALDALATAALSPAIYVELCRTSSPPPPVPPVHLPAALRGEESTPGNSDGGPGQSVPSPGASSGAILGSRAPQHRVGVHVLLDAGAGMVQRDPGVMVVALRVLETCCYPHKACTAHC